MSGKRLALMATVRADKRGRPICSGCQRPGPGYDTLWPPRQFEFALCIGVASRRYGRPSSECLDVGRATGLGPASDRRVLPAAEGLPLHDGTGHVAIHVCIADLDAFQPPLDLVLVERLDATGQAQVAGVLDGDRVVQIVGTNDAEHGAEALSVVEPRARPHAQPNPR